VKSGDWSSPGKLIHPGDLANIASVPSGQGELDLLLRSWQLGKGPKTTAGDSFHRGVAAQLLISGAEQIEWVTCAGLQ